MKESARRRSKSANYFHQCRGHYQRDRPAQKTVYVQLLHSFNCTYCTILYAIPFALQECAICSSHLLPSRLWIIKLQPVLFKDQPLKIHTHTLIRFVLRRVSVCFSLSIQSQPWHSNAFSQGQTFPAFELTAHMQRARDQVQDQGIRQGRRRSEGRVRRVSKRERKRAGWISVRSMVGWCSEIGWIVMSAESRELSTEHTLIFAFVECRHCRVVVVVL